MDRRSRPGRWVRGAYHHQSERMNFWTNALTPLLLPIIAACADALEVVTEAASPIVQPDLTNEEN